jgi:hypothetical protein
MSMSCSLELFGGPEGPATFTTPTFLITSGERLAIASFGIARILSLLHCIALLYINPPRHDELTILYYLHRLQRYTQHIRLENPTHLRPSQC